MKHLFLLRLSTAIILTSSLFTGAQAVTEDGTYTVSAANLNGGMGEDSVPLILNLQPSTLNLQPSTLNLQPSTLNPLTTRNPMSFFKKSTVFSKKSTVFSKKSMGLSDRLLSDISLLHQPGQVQAVQHVLALKWR